MSKRPRTLDSFFSPPPLKRPKAIKDEPDKDERVDPSAPSDKRDGSLHSKHETYPFDVPYLPSELQETLNFVPASEGRVIRDQPDLDLLYYTPFVPKEAQADLFEFLRRELFFYVSLSQ